MQEPSSPITVAIVNDYDVVVQGLRRMLQNAHPLRVVELDTHTSPAQPVDIVLYDTFAAPHGEGSDLERLLRHPNVGRLVVYSWNLECERVSEAVEAGAAGYLAKSLDRSALVDALLRVARGESVITECSPDLAAMSSNATAGREWPGRSVGLSAREAEVIALITQGMTNDEIAAHLFLSLNSVKSYIRSAYRKIRVERRSQAVLWGIQHGFLPEPRSTRVD